MNITELRYLVAIMKWGSVSAAAKQLYAAQPNVSKALKNLEEEYGLRIFERSSTGMIPTEQGKRFIRQAQRVLQQVDELKQEAHQQRSCAELRVVLTHATSATSRCCGGRASRPWCATSTRKKKQTGSSSVWAGAPGAQSLCWGVPSCSEAVTSTPCAPCPRARAAA